MKKRVAVVGATGYSGAELVLLLSRHSGVTLAGVFSGPDGAAAPFAAIHPGLAGHNGPAVRPFQLEALLDCGPEVVFLATPNELSAGLVPELHARKLTAIDLSGAYRLRQAELYPAWYGFTHPAPHLLPSSVYGLTEWCDGELKGATLVANPGCYATAALLALKPLLPLLDPAQPIVCDAKSGVSGAGKRSELDYSFVELSGNFKAYGVGTHRHEPEIRSQAGIPGATPFFFVPHLLPTPRGILSTLYLAFDAPRTETDVAQCYEAAYQDAPCVDALPAGRLPELRQVVGTPRARIGFRLVDGGCRAVIVSVIDNLLKGAASQAVQNFNRMAGFPETEGLS